MAKITDAPAALDDYMRERTAEIDAALARYIAAPPRCPADIADAMRYSLMAGGKRLRPLLTLSAADAVRPLAGLSPTEARAYALPAACAIEMIHTYSLIHDDLPAMDDDTMRRGRPTLHVVVGDGMAILAGDGLQAEAFALAAREPESQEPAVMVRKLEVIGIIADAAGPVGMVGGQAIDLSAVKPSSRGLPVALDYSALQDMHARKTGALIRAAAVCGAVMAGGDRRTIDAIDRYAMEIGLAFQIVDDVLDVEAASDTLGKTAGKDAAAGKPTYPSMVGLERSRELAADCVARALESLDTVELGSCHLAGIAQRILTRRS